MLVPDEDDLFSAIVMCHGYESARNEAGGGYMMIAPQLAETGISSIGFVLIRCDESEKPAEQPPLYHDSKQGYLDEQGGTTDLTQL